jgi:hypothetical protein
MRDGPDWERPHLPLVSRWFSTVSGVFTKPTETFATLKLDGGLGAPLAFGVIGTTIGSVAATIYQVGFEAIGLTAQFGAGGNDEQAMASALGSGIGLVIGICLAPVFALIGMFISAGITHLMLMMLGGAEKGFEVTFRSVAYVSGSINLLNIIPGCGGCIAIVWYIIAAATALSQTHEISLGKAYAAVIIPILICCFAIGGLVVLFGILAAAAASA